MAITLDQFDKKQIMMGTAGLCGIVMLLCWLLVSAQRNPVQLWLYDTAQRHATVPPPSHVAIVAIDDASKARLGEWPWSNNTHAKLIDILRGAGAEGIAFTTPLYANNNGTDQAGTLTAADQRLIEAMQQARVLLPLEVSTQVTEPSSNPQAVASLLSHHPFNGDARAMAAAKPATLISAVDNPLLQYAYAVGHTLAPAGPDGIARRELAAVKLGDQLLPGLAVALAGTAEQAGDKQLSASRLSFGGSIKPSALHDQLSFLPRLNAPEGERAVPAFPYWQVLNRNVARNNFKGKLVLVGFIEGANADRVLTPFGSEPRVVMMASAAESLMDGNTYAHPLWAAILQWLLIAGIIAMLVYGSTTLPMLTRIGLTGGVVVVLLIMDFLLLRSSNVSLELMPMITGLIFSTALLETALLLLGNEKPRKKSSKNNISLETLRTLALTLHGQGQLDLAYETLRRCAVTDETLELLYRLGADFERRTENRKAAQVYAYIAQHNPAFKDAQQRSKLLLREAMPLQKPVSKKIAETPSAKTETPPAKQETLGRYVIEKEIGKGAMGVVYLGRDPKISRVVAIKAIPLTDEFEDDDLAEARDRFFREAQMAGRLNHPGIVTIFDAGEERGLAYIAMEFIQGQHLSYYTDPQRLLPVRKVLSLVVRMAEALHYAHLHNVVHRDIKPANIMFNIETDALKITDFGIARLADVSRTKTGIVLGTPSFMSPEQLEGRPLDGRSDLFALGVTMYQLLTGILPFRADSMTRLMNNIATEPHPPLRSVRPELPAGLDDVMDRALAKSADDRFQTGAAFAEAIRTCMRSIAP
ncbi:MAG TPA: serine/threonine-protein kinase [Steroidobacteraceae bacterium]|nr:serine/threonine-protein kinase [Steroidobacteraceae bacterium]